MRHAVFAQALHQVGALAEGHVAVVVAVDDQHGRAPLRHVGHGRRLPGHAGGRLGVGGTLVAVGVEPLAHAPHGAVVHAVDVHAGGEEVRVASQRHGRQVAAIAAPVDAHAVGAHERQLGQPAPRRLDVLILGAAAPAGPRRVVELVAVADAQPVVDREDHEAQAGEVLVDGVGVRVVGRVVPAQQHLSGRAAVHVHHGRARVVFRGAFRQKERAVDAQAVGRAEDDLCGGDQLLVGEVGRDAVFAQQAHPALVEVVDGGQRRPLGRGADERHVAAVGQGEGRPLEAVAGREHARRHPIDGHLQHVAPFQVERVGARVGGAVEVFAIGAEADVFAHVGAGREAARRAALGRNAVQVGPAVVIAQKDDAVVGPVQVGAAVGGGIRAAQRLGRFPQQAAGVAAQLGHAYLPGPVALGEDGVGRTAAAGAPHEGDRLAVGRPAGRLVAVVGGVEPAQRLPLAAPDADEGVVAAVGAEGQHGAVGRPHGRVVAAARVEELARLGAAVERRHPDLTVAHEGHPPAVGRDGGLLARTQGARRALVEGHHPQLHLGRLGQRVRVDGQRVVPVGAEVAAADVHHPGAIWRKPDTRQRLARVVVVAGALARHEVGRFGHPEVAAPLLVERPGDAVGLAGGRQARGERVRHHLLEAEGLRAQCGGKQQAHGRQEAFGESRKSGCELHDGRVCT